LRIARRMEPIDDQEQEFLTVHGTARLSAGTVDFRPPVRSSRFTSSESTRSVDCAGGRGRSGDEHTPPTAEALCKSAPHRQKRGRRQASIRLRVEEHGRDNRGTRGSHPRRLGLWTSVRRFAKASTTGSLSTRSGNES
jgi:hypothetical protein